MTTTQAQAENDGRTYWAETEMTEPERREYEAWLDAAWQDAKLAVVESGEVEF